MSDRFILFSDFHIHNHANDWRKVDDALEVLDWIHKEAVDRKIDKVFFLGDFFHVRGYMYPSIVARAYKALAKFRDSDIEMFLLVGNHDMPYKNTTKHNCITAFGDLAHIIEQPMVYEGANYDFYLLPYVESTSKLNWAIDKLSQIAKGGEVRNGNTISRKATTNSEKQNVLLAHLDIKGAKFHTHVKSTHGTNSTKLSKAFDLVLTGHYHTHQQVKDNVWYIGSPYQINFGEAGEQKGFIVFDDGELEFVENTFSPKYMYVSPSEIDDRITDNYVTITVDDSSNLIQVREKAAKYNPRNVNVKIDRAQLSEERQLISMKNDAKDVKALLKEWVDKTANASIYNKEKLYSYGIAIVEESNEE